MRTDTLGRALVAGTLLAAPALAQQGPAVRPLGPVVATSREALGSVQGVRHLPSGAVVVNDMARRRLVLFDPALASVTVIADSTSATANAYGSRVGGLLPWKGDSALFVDPASSSMLVVDASGKIARVMSAPRSQDVGILASTGSGVPGFDASGRLVYRTMVRGAPTVSQGNPGSTRGVSVAPPTMPDSQPIVAVDLATRVVDTIARVKVPRPRMSPVTMGEGMTMMRSVIDPLPQTDDWAVLSDGTIAIVRGADYSVDFIRPDGSQATTGKLPYAWERLTDEAKAALMDSVREARANMPAQAAGAAGGVPVQMTFSGTAGGGGGGGGGQRVVMMGDGPAMAMGAAGGAGAHMPPPEYILPSELPDYKPPFSPGAARADEDGNLWILTRPTRATDGGPIYDIVNTTGLVDRVQLPKGMALAGFGPGGIVYLTTRESGQTYLARARMK
jgi:hypothetical protein